MSETSSEMQVIDPRELNDLAAFAARGGLGQAVATQDCVAESPDQLMYIAGDTLVLLRDMGEIALAACEGVVGWIKKGDVQFDTIAGASSVKVKVPDTIVSSPTPPTRTVDLPAMDQTEQEQEQEQDGGLGSATWSQTPEAKRASGPFDLGTPQYSPEIPQVDTGYFAAQQKRDTSSEPEDQSNGDGRVRSSVLSTASSEALGGIGGFMMGVGDDSMDGADIEELTDDISPAETVGTTPQKVSSPPNQTRSQSSLQASPSPSLSRSLINEPVSPTSSKGGRPGSSDSWDIYGDYARDSMYYKRSTRDLKAMSGVDQAFNLAKALASIPSPPPPVRAATQASATTPGPPVELGAISPRSRSRPKPLPLDLNIASPGLEQIRDESKRDQAESPVEGNGSSVATALRMRIQNERKQSLADTPRAEIVNGDDQVEDEEVKFAPSAPVIPPKSSSRLNAAVAQSTASITPPTLFVTNAEESDEESPNGDSADIGNESHVTEVSAVSDSEQSTVIETPIGPSTDETADITVVKLSLAESPAAAGEGEHSKTPLSSSPTLLASPIPLDESTSTVTTPEPPSLQPSPRPQDSPDFAAGQGQRATPSVSPSLGRNLSPALSQPGSPFSPGSPASPHSVAATRQAAVEIARSASTPVQERNRVTTLLGRTDDLLGSKGPVPITFHMGSPGGFRSQGPVTMASGSKEAAHGLGLGLPSTSSKGRISPSAPVGGPRRATSPLITSPLIEQPLSGFDDSRFPRSPVTARNASSPVQTYTTTNPVPAPVPPATSTSSAKSSPNTGTGTGFFPRARSRSFGATVAKAIGRGKKEKPPPPPLAINTALSPKSANVPALPPTAKKDASGEAEGKTVSQQAGSVPSTPKQTDIPSRPPPPPPNDSPSAHTLPSQSTDSLPSPRTAGFPPRTPGSTGKTPKKPSKTLPSPVSHRDYAEETVKADGLDFELVQPKANLLLSPGSPTSTTHSQDGEGGSPRPGMMNRSETFKSDLSVSSARSLPLPETDEWGFLKDQSPTPEMFQSRSTASDHRVAEQKWLSIVSTPLPAGSAIPKKVRKLALDSGVPASLRGKVWGWMLGSFGQKRVPGLYSELSSAKIELDPKIESAIASVFADHSVFAGPYATGTTDLRTVLVAYSRHTSSPVTSQLASVAGMLLIHCVAEDAFWLLDGLFGKEGLMREYHTAEGVKVDAAVFAGVLAGSEKIMRKKFKEMGLHPRSFLEKWYQSLFIRCLPWPTALRVIDVLIAEGPRFLLVASLSILTLSRDRIMAFTSKDQILSYLVDLPQDALLLPEHFMKACAEVKFRDEDYKRLRVGVEKEMGLVNVA